MILASGLAAFTHSACAADTTAPAATTASEDMSGLPEVVVTARRREENLQTVPVAVEALSGDAVDSRGSFSIQDLVEQAPSLSFVNQSGTASDVVLAIRGQSKTYGARFDSTLAYFDEVPILKFTTGQFFDLDSIQVLSGPQGTLFGRVTDGGNIMVNPKRPSTEDFGGYFEARVGDYNLSDFLGALNLPLISDKLAVRLAFDINKRDGYTYDVLTNQDLDNVNYKAYRVGVLFKPTDDIENYTVYTLNEGNTNGSSNEVSYVNPALISGATTGTAEGFGIPAATAIALGAQTAAAFSAAYAAQQKNGPRWVDEGNLGFGANGGMFDISHDYYVINTTTWKPESDLQFKNIFGYVRVYDHWGADYDGSPVAFIDEGNPIYPHYDFNYQQWSDEFQIQGKIDHLQYTAGAYFDEQNTAHPSENQTVELQVIDRIDLQYEVTRSRAGYGQVRYDLGQYVPGLNLDAGIRYTYDTTVSDNASEIGLWDPTDQFGFGSLGLGSQNHGQCNSTNDCVQTTTSSHAITWTGGLDYDINDKTMAYFKVSKGYRPGGINSVSGDPALGHYGPEYDTSFEIGLKADYQFGGMAGRTNVAAFDDFYTKIQKLVDTVGADGTIDSVITNAPNARIWGVELEQTFIPLTGLQLKFDYTYLEAGYEKNAALEKTACFAPYEGFCDLSRFQGAPRNSGTFDTHYTLPWFRDIGTFAVGGNIYGRGLSEAGDTSFYDPHWGMPGYFVTNFDTSWDKIYGSSVGVRFFMTNAFNRAYIVGTTSIEHSLGFAAEEYGAPRMWGFAVRYQFGKN
jgi:iron complex outermembrane receptor protein